MILLLLLGCAARHRSPVSRLEPAALSVDLDAPRCASSARAPSVEEITEGHDSGWTVRGCFPVELSGQGPCEWACVVSVSGWCGNGPGWDVLAVLQLDDDEYVRAGTSTVTDHEDWFERSFRVRARGGRPVLLAEMGRWDRQGPAEVEVLRLRDGVLRVVARERQSHRWRTRR